MAGIKIPVEAQVNAADLQQATQQFVQQFNKLGSVVAQANKIKFDPISQATIEDLRKVERQFESLRKISGALNRRMKDTGQVGAGFFDVDWGRMYSDPNARAREMRKAFEYVTGHAFSAGAVVPAPQRPPVPSSPPPRSPAPSPGVHWAGAGRRVVSAGLQAAGGAGGAADGALSAGLSGGVMAGLAGLVGGIVALGVGKAVGAVMGKIGDAQNELIQIDTLKRTLGDVNVGFEVLKESLRATADELQIPINEAGRMGTEFAKIANLAPDAHRTLASEVAIAGGFGRSFGMDPATSASFFAQMRLMRVTETEQDSRRMSLMIGEAIARSGAFSKADEILQAIGNFATQQTRLGLASANVGGFAGMLSGMVASGTPGMDPQGAASLLMRVNSSIASGGAAGEAGQNFLYMALGRRLGLNPIQTRALQEQGAFGTAASAFGTGSTYARFSAAFGGSTPAMSSMSQTMTLPMIMEHFKRVYAGRPDLMADAISNLFGIGLNQAMELALAAENPEVLGGTHDRLKRLNPNFDLTRMSHTGIAALSRIQSGSLGELQAQATSLRSRTGEDALTADEIKKLNDVMSGDNLEAMRDVLTELTVTREQERTDGEQTRDKLVRIDNTMQKAAGAMVPLLTDMRAGILMMAGGGKMGPMGIRMAVAEAESKERLSALHSSYGALRAGPEEDLQRAIEMGSDVSEDAIRMAYRDRPDILEHKLKEREAAIAMRNRAQAELDRIAREQDAAVAAENARLGAEKEKIKSDVLNTTPGVSDSLFDALIQQESGGRHYGADGDLLTNPRTGARGIAQILPSTGRAPGLGVTPLQNDSEAEHMRLSRDYLNALLRRYGGDRKKALAAYNWGMKNVDKAVAMYGDDWLAHAPRETQDYVPSVLARAGESDVYNRDLPGDIRTADASTAQVNVNVNVNGRLQNDRGEDRGAIDAATVKKTVSLPRPYGAPA